METEESQDKANRPKPPKPPLPPKPVGYRSPSETRTGSSTRGVESRVSLENYVPCIVVQNTEEHNHGLPTDNNNNTGQEQRRLADSSSAQQSITNGETTPKTIAPSAITSKSTSDAIDALKGNINKIPKSVMAREESFDSVENEVCCTNLASYFVHKAKALSHPSNKNKRVPPPKPPKPKKEDIERARKRLSSFGEEIPGGKAGFRYVDDESTESSVDYKDVIFENGKILAINLLPKPPKCDSPEPEPVPKECDYEPLEFFHRNIQQSCDDCDDNVFIETGQGSALDISGGHKVTHEEIRNVVSNENDINQKIRNATDLEIKKETRADFDIDNQSEIYIKQISPCNVSENDLKLDLSNDILNDQSKTKEEEATSCKSTNEKSLKTEEENFVSKECPVIDAKEYENILSFFLKEEQKPEDVAPDPSVFALSDDKSLCDLSLQKQQSSQNPQDNHAVYIGSSDRRRKSLSEERHSWPVHGKKPGKSPPDRPPPPRRKCLSLSDDDQTIRSQKVKPPRPPPPTPPTSLKRTSHKEDPRPPPRQRRSRSRTVELTQETIKSISQTGSSVRRSVSFTDRSKFKPDIKAMYSTIDPSKKQQPYDKMKFRPLPPPPAPPRSHSKKTDNLSLETSFADNVSVRDKNSSGSPGKVSKFCKDSGKETEKNIKTKPARPNKPVFTASHGKELETLLADENANLPPSSQIPLLSDVQDCNVTDQNKEQDKGDKLETPRQYSCSTFYCDNLNTSCAVTGSRSKSPSPVGMRACVSASRIVDGTESEVSGVNADVDSSTNSSRRVSVERTFSKSKKSDRSSVFYYDIPQETRECMEKSVQTSPDFSSCQVTDKGEDSDELMDIANDIRRELNSILERRQNAESTDSDFPSSQDELPVQRIIRGGPGSSRSSEVSWQESSEESEAEPDGTLKPMTPEQKRLNKLKCIAKELMTSESTFVDALRLLNVDFLNAVHKSSSERGSPIVPDEVMNNIFRYLPQLQNLNENLLQEIQQRTDNWESYQKISDVIVKIGPFLKLYSSYIREFESVTVMLDEACRKYPHFNQVVKDFEASSICQKLALKHFLLKPVQRIPQYRLLLEDYLHNLSPSSVDYEDTIKALQIVSEVANHANETMKQGDNFLKLVSIQNSLLTHHEIVKPGRVFLKEGELQKLSRRVEQQRWFILFNDSLLYLTPVQQGLYRINHELPLTGMRVSVPMQAEYRNEFSVISATRSFSLAAKSAEERDEWITDLTRAIEENAVKRSSFINMQMHQQGKSSFLLPDTALGKQAPVWIPDSRVTMCQLCTTEFTITYRRHHCRACGRVVCSACSLNKANLHYLNNQLGRVCDACHEKLDEDNDRDSRTLYTSSTDQRTTDSEVEVARSVSTGATAAVYGAKQGLKKNNLPSVLKERSKRDSGISSTPFSRVRANDQGSDISGHLFLLNRRAWKRFWFVVKDKVLYTYKASEDVAAKKSLPLLGFSVETTSMPYQGIDPNLIFILKHPGQPNMVFHAESVGFAERWVKTMRNATVL